MAGYSNMNVDDLRNTLDKALRGQEVQPRKENKWQNALKTCNTGNSSFIIPKKGSDQYKEVIDIMNGTRKQPTSRPEGEEVLPRKRGRLRKQVTIDQNQKLLTSMFRKG